MPLTQVEISEIFAKITPLKVAILGDFAIDFYFDLDQQTSEYSLETKKEVFWAKNPKTSLGGAGNVCANLASLGVKNLYPFGVIGDDIFGREMINLINKIGANTEGILKLSNWNTCTYTKPISNLKEQNRIDFGTNNDLSENYFENILSSLENKLPDLDLLLINQQFPKPLLTTKRIEKLNALIQKYPNCLYVSDLRNYGLTIRNSILKVNVSEMAQLLKLDMLKECEEIACKKYMAELSEKISCQILLTRGKYGLLFYDKHKHFKKEAIKIDAEVDTVGAGDTALAAFAIAYKTGKEIVESLEIANLAAAISIQKLNQTGTASESEIIKLISEL